MENSSHGEPPSRVIAFDEERPWALYPEETRQLAAELIERARQIKTR
jgi:hypothetical protein